MATRSKNIVLDVYLNEALAGELVQSTTGATVFTYAKEWLQRPSASPISQSLPLSTEPLHGIVVMNYFDNLLPDNDNIRKLIAQRNHALSDRTLDLLSAIGRDCVGALQFLPKGTTPTGSKIKSVLVSDDEIASILKNLGKAPLGINIEEDFRISIAGAQEKTAFLKRADGWHVPHGTTPTTHIFKIPMGQFQSGIDMRTSVENEWLCLQLCRAFGLETANAEIATFGGEKALVVERFDRIADGPKILRIPQEDFCQVLGYASSQKYERGDGGPGIKDIVSTLSQSLYPLRDRRTFMKTQALFWLLGATDGHAKNFSVFSRDDGFELTPVYDVLSAFPVAASRTIDYEKLKLAMAVGQNRHWKLNEILGKHWLQTAKLSRFPEFQMKEILTELIETADHAIATVEKLLPKGFPEDVAAPIFAGIKKHANLWKLEKLDSK
jgi:serine/threonine-protein kinase HipA